MSNLWIRSLCLMIYIPVFAGEAGGQTAPIKEVIGFPGSNVDVVYLHPNASVWEPLDLKNPPRPDMINRNLRHRGIRDSRGIDVHPIMSITAWKFPDDKMTLKGFSNYLLKRAAFKINRRETINGRIYLQGTTNYGGYTHIIRRAFSFNNRVGIDLICDSTSTVLEQVKDDFDTWLRSAELDPRIVPVRVQLAEVTSPEPPKDEVVVTKKQVIEKQTPGGPLKGDIAGIKDHGGMVIVWNQSAPYFKVKVEGSDVAGYGSEYLMFTVDGVLLQIQSTELKDFCPDGSLKDPEAILIAHRDWEFRYIEDVLHAKCALRSWTGRLADGSPVLYWDVTPEQAPPKSAGKRLFCTRYKDGSVITVNSTETSEVSLDRAVNLAFYAISHIEFSREKFDMKKIQEQLRARK